MKYLIERYFPDGDSRPTQTEEVTGKNRALEAARRMAGLKRLPSYLLRWSGDAPPPGYRTFAAWHDSDVYGCGGVQISQRLPGLDRALALYRKKGDSAVSAGWCAEHLQITRSEFEKILAREGITRNLDSAE